MGKVGKLPTLGKFWGKVWKEGEGERGKGKKGKGDEKGEIKGEKEWGRKKKRGRIGIMLLGGNEKGTGFFFL